METGKNLELRRQIFHATLGIVLVYSLNKNLIDINFLFFALVIGFIISLISKKYNLIGVSWLLKNFGRENEAIPGYGVLTYLIGSVIAIGLFKKEIALASIMILAFGDSASHLGRFGKIKNPLSERKFLEGTLFGIVAGTLAASLFVSWKTAFFGSLIAMGVEGFELVLLKKKIDDNLLIPIVSGLIMSLF